MFWLILVVIVLVVGAAALVALGGGGSLPDAERDRLAPHLPDDRALNRADVDELRFPMALRGYRMDEVDDVLDRVGAELSHRDLRIAELEAALAAALDGAQPTVAATRVPPGRPADAADRPGDAPEPGTDAS